MPRRSREPKAKTALSPDIVTGGGLSTRSRRGHCPSVSVRARSPARQLSSATPRRALQGRSRRRPSNRTGTRTPPAALGPTGSIAAAWRRPKPTAKTAARSKIRCHRRVAASGRSGVRAGLVPCCQERSARGRQRPGTGGRARSQQNIPGEAGILYVGRGDENERGEREHRRWHGPRIRLRAAQPPPASA